MPTVLPEGRGPVRNGTDAATYLGFTRQRLSQLVQDGSGPTSYLVGKSYLYFERDLDEWKAGKVRANRYYYDYST